MKNASYERNNVLEQVVLLTKEHKLLTLAEELFNEVKPEQEVLSGWEMFGTSINGRTLVIDKEYCLSRHNSSWGTQL